MDSLGLYPPPLFKRLKSYPSLFGEPVSMIHPLNYGSESKSFMDRVNQLAGFKTVSDFIILQ